MVNRKISNTEYPLITIITVSYNAFDTIESTILNVIGQSYPNIEYIIIDGGSNDGTIDIIKKYANNISYWISESDRGIYDAMNKGIKVATGKWINFMNAGDIFYSSDTILNVSHFFVDANDLIYGKTNMVLPHGSFIRTCTSISSSNPMPFVHQSSFCKTELLKKYYFSLDFKYAADYHFFNQIFGCTTACYCNEIIATYSLDGISSHNSIRVNKERIASNPCWQNYWTQALCYRNYWIKFFLKMLHIDVDVVKKYIYKTN